MIWTNCQFVLSVFSVFFYLITYVLFALIFTRKKLKSFVWCRMRFESFSNKLPSLRIMFYALVFVSNLLLLSSFISIDYYFYFNGLFVWFVIFFSECCCLGGFLYHSSSCIAVNIKSAFSYTKNPFLSKCSIYTDIGCR